jgi:hypothetical protein
MEKMEKMEGALHSDQYIVFRMYGYGHGLMGLRVTNEAPVWSYATIKTATG